MNEKDIKTKIRKEIIIKQCMEMFSDVGYDNFTINAFCQKYHISKGILYHNFSGKEELFLECVRICHEEIVLFLGKNGIPDFEKYIELRLKFYSEHPQLARIFYESIIQKNTALHNEIDLIRTKFHQFNEQVYLKFLSKFELKEGVS